MNVGGLFNFRAGRGDQWPGRRAPALAGPGERRRFPVRGKNGIKNKDVIEGFHVYCSVDCQQIIYKFFKFSWSFTCVFSWEVLKRIAFIVLRELQNYLRCPGTLRNELRSPEILQNRSLCGNLDLLSVYCIPIASLEIPFVLFSSLHLIRVMDSAWISSFAAPRFF